MATNKELNDALARLEALVSNLEAPESIKAIDAEIAQPANADHVPHFEVHKAAVLRGAGQIADAARLLSQTAARHDEVDSVHFFAGQYFLELGQHARAVDHLSRCIDLCERSGEGWYLDSAYLLRAYAAAKSGQTELARSDLSHIEDDDPMSWVEAEPVVSRSSIETLLGDAAARLPIQKHRPRE